MTGNFYNHIRVLESVTIPNGNTDSNAIDVKGATMVAIITPSVLTGTTFTFQVSEDGTNFNTLYSATGNIITVNVGTERFIALSPQDFAAVTHLQLISSASEGADRIIQLVLRGV